MVTILKTMEGGIGHILQDGSSESYVDDLHAFADAQYRKVPPKAEFKCLKLQDVQFRVDIPGAGVVLSEKAGSDIAASGQNQSITP